jgi:hypothetical protein
VIYDVYPFRGPRYVPRVEYRTRHELDVEAREGLGQVSGLQHANLLSVLEEPPNENVTETAAATCDKGKHAAE